MNIRQQIRILSLGLLVFCCGSCQPAGSGYSGTNQPKALEEKPVIDSSRVPDILELYRAKRFESISEAQFAGRETVFKLVLQGRSMGSLSADISEFTYLASLDVAFNELTDLPEEVSDLHYLQGFYANGNKLREFPEEILRLPILARVDLSENQISVITKEISQLDQLTRLSLSSNLLMEIPTALYKLKNLLVLELDNNGLSELPAGISALTSLKKLNLAKNQLKSIPREIISLSQTLVELDIKGNQIPGEEIDWLKEAMPLTEIRF